LDQGSLLPIEYWHRPVVPLKTKLNSGIVIGVTNYQGRERQYVAHLAEAIGMLSQEIFAKKDKNGAKRSTHLVIIELISIS
jgi:hypothetical protein